MENFNNPEFLKKKYNLHNTEEVAVAKKRTEKREGKKISQNPNEQIQNYLDRFKEILNRKDPEKRKQGIEDLRKILYKNLIIKDEDINYDYFLKQEQLIAEQQGRGILEAPQNFNEKKKEEIQKDQKSSLDYWINYLTSPDAPYPDWAKYWAFRSMTEMGGYNKKEKKFSKREKDSAQAFPTLNAGCLADVIGAVVKKQKYDALEKDIKKTSNESEEDFKKRKDDFNKIRNNEFQHLSSEFKELLTTENFSKLYTHALEQFGDLKWENLENIKGVWKTYKQGTNAKILSDSLQGFPLEWCTRNEDTAKSQLQGGDFHVYYSEDSSGIPNVPRLAIRMNGRRNYSDNDEEKQDQNDTNEEVETNEEILISKPASGGHTIFENFSDEQKKTLGLDSTDLQNVYNSSKNAQKYSIIKNQFTLDKSQTIAEVRGIEAGQNIDRFIQPVLDEKLKEFEKEGEVYLKKSEDMKEMTRVTEKHRTGQILNADDLRFLYEVDSKIEGFGYKDDPRIEQILKDRNIKEDLGLIFNTQEDDNKLLILLAENKNSLLDKYFSLFDNLNNEMAFRMIELGHANLISRNLEKFNELNRELALKLLENGAGSNVVQNLEKFTGLDTSDYNNLAFKLIEDGITFMVVDNLEKFKGLKSSDYADIALKIIEKGAGVAIVKNIKKFKEIDNNQIASALIKAGNHRSTIDELKGLDYRKIFLDIVDNPQGQDQSKIVLWFIQAGILFYKDYFDKLNVGLNSKVAESLLEEKEYYLVANNLEKFTGLDYDKIALELIKKGEVDALKTNFEKFDNLSMTTALSLIKEKKGYYVVNNLNKFRDLNQNLIVSNMIKMGDTYELRDSFKNLDKLDPSLAFDLIKSGETFLVLSNFEKFTGINHEQTINEIFKVNEGGLIALFLEKFKDIKPAAYKAIAFEIIKTGGGEYLIRGLEKFTGLDHNEIALEIIKSLKNDRNSEYVCNRFFSKLEKFETLGYEVVSELIKIGKGREVAQNLEKFTGLKSSDYNHIALKLIETGEGVQVVLNLKKFKEIDEKTKEILREKYPEYVSKIQ
jgi:hypothetical protein